MMMMITVIFLLFCFLFFWVLVLLTLTETITGLYLIFWWRFGPIPGHGIPLRIFAITLRHTTLDSTPLDECSARRRDLYLTTPNTDKRHSFPTAEFGPTIPASGWPQTPALDRAAT